MRYRTSFVVGLLTVGLMAGCAGGGPGRSIDDPSNSLVFGYVDMSDAPTSVSWAKIMQVAPPTDKPYWSAGVRDGLFYNYYLPPGSYKLSTLGGSGFFKGEYQYNFPKQGSSQGVRIERPGIYYLGSYKFKKVKTGLFEAGKFDIERVNQPTEAELLKRIMDKDSEVKGSVWERKIRARLAQLKS